jgi:predicted metal-dependent hydrolase
MNKSEIISKHEGINYRAVFSGRRTIGISISPDKGVVIRAPFRTPSTTIEEIIRSKSNWIRKHQVKFQKYEKAGISVDYSDGSYHLFIGESYILKTIRADKPFVHKTDNLIEIGLINPDDHLSVKRIMYKWYKNEAAIFFSDKLKDVLSRLEPYNFKPAILVIRTMKRRWGSCSVKGKITLNTELIKMAEPCIEYVIIHELCHLRHHNHGKEFYALMSEIVPDWKLYRRKLKDHLM